MPTSTQPPPVVDLTAADEPPTTERVRILHVSDTHGLHREIERDFPMPAADILVHTGDFTDSGARREFADFDAWLGSLRPRYPHIVVAYGNHEYSAFLYEQGCAATREASAAGREWHRPSGARQKQLLPSATHVLEHEAADVCGLRFFGSAWCCWHRSHAPGDARRGPEGVHRFDEIPPGVDVLLTHGAPYGIFDRMEDSRAHWGSSRALRTAIEAARPRAHLFGHIHEQRGAWLKRGADGAYVGGVEYQRTPGEAWPTFAPPPPSYPCELISCNAMKNHPALEGGAAERIAGPARLIVATRAAPDRPWRFRTEVAGAQ